MSAVRYGWFRVRSECPHCGQPLPLNAPAQHVSCAHCSKDVRIQDDLWRKVLARYEDEHASLPVGEKRPCTETIAGSRVSYEYAHGGLACEKCGTQVAVEQLEVGVARDFACGQCGDLASTCPAPPWLQQLVPTARQLYSVDPGTGRAPDALQLDAAKQAVRPVVMACPQCGGSLSATTESERIMSCQYCQSDVYLPDEVWRRLHPIKMVTPFFIRFDGQTRAQLAAAREAESQRARQAQIRHNQAEYQRGQQRVEAQKREAEAARLRELDATIARLKMQAWVATLISCAVLGAFAAWTWLAPQLVGVSAAHDSVGDYTLAFGAAAVLVFLVAMFMAGRPLQRRTGNPGEWLLFVTWFWVIFALVMPVVGSVMALFSVYRLLRGRIGSMSISSGHHSISHYVAVTLTQGEGYPAAMLFIAIAILWPAAFVGLDPSGLGL